MKMQGFVLMGRRRDGVSPTAEFTQGDDVAQVMEEARTFLDSHPSCDLVEIWRDDVKLASVSKRGQPPPAWP